MQILIAVDWKRNWLTYFCFFVLTIVVVVEAGEDTMLLTKWATHRHATLLGVTERFEQDQDQG